MSTLSETGPTPQPGQREENGSCSAYSLTDQSYAVHLTLLKKNGTISLDFSETDDQARGAVNFIMHDSVPKFMYGLYLAASDPTILLNHGFAQAIDEVKTRPGSLVNPTSPAPLGMRSNTMLRVNNCVFGTLALATDGQTNAASSVYVIYMLRSLNRQSGDCTLCIEGLGVGFGARPFADGPDAIYYVAQKNYPVEFAEMEFAYTGTCHKRELKPLSGWGHPFDRPAASRGATALE